MTNSLATIDPSHVRTYSVGLDSLFDSLFDPSSFSTSNYPPYNIIKHDDEQYTIELALAGFKREDIEIETKENRLTVRSLNLKKDEENFPTYLHRGISQRQFNRSFTLGSDIYVKGAKLEDGMLKINLKKVIPDEKRARLIDIG